MRVTFCGECGVKANPNKNRCHLCGGRLPHSRAIIRNPGVYSKMAQERPKAVIFDLDMTIFNNSQRFTDARRAGLVDKDGKAVTKGMMSTGQAWRKRNKFIYSDKALAKDTVIPGAKELISDLSNEGYVIVYLTARPEQYYEASLKQLESNGFPLYRDKNDKILLITKPVKSSHTAKYKANAARELSGEFKVEMVFDDDKKVLEEMAKLRIPGLYASISDHVKTNPGAGDVYVTKSDPEAAYLARPDPDDPDGRTVGETMGIETAEEEELLTLDDFLAQTELPNPLPKPKRKKLKTGKFRKEPARKYLSRLMGIPKMREDFPDSKQRFAVAIGLVKKYYNAETANRIAPRSNPIKKKKFKIHAGDISGTKKGSVYATVQVGRNIVMDVGEGIQDVYRGLIGGRQSMTEKRLAMGVAEMEKDLMEQAKKLGANAVSNLQIDYEPQYRGEVTILATGEAVKTRASVKKNPASPKKVEKGKKLYKHMNGQDPEKVGVEKIDIGDVWYKVGEGGCWQIGYMSGKETGQESQKYIHTFNEETKDGNFPELYATMPESGKPMLIIKGGTWKIKTDDKGVAWIYD